MYKIGIIGDKDSILGFKALGLDVFPVTQPKEAEEILAALADQQYAVIYITEQIARSIIPIMDRYSKRMFPAIIPVPGNQGGLGIGMESVKKSVERAVGADILFNKD
ncbi:MAG: V-type ATP synthase subunit F [Acetivibrionales bacterium]|jgi:V/A-type H+-transporting ATPase subunit F